MYNNPNLNYNQYNNLNYNTNNSSITNSFTNLSSNLFTNNFNINNYNNNNFIREGLSQRKNSFTSCSCPELVKLYNENEKVESIQLQKGFKDVENIYRQSCLNNIRDRWKITLQCNYYCNLNQNDLYNDIYDEYDGEHLGI